MSDEATVPVTATAKVRVEMEISLTSPWPGGATLEEVHKAARAEAVNKVLSLLGRRDSGEFRVIGAVEVRAIIVTASHR